MFDGHSPSAADVALWYQLDWGEKISRGEGIGDLTGHQTTDGDGEGMSSVFNRERYPGLTAWFERVKTFFDGLPSTETRVERGDEEGVKVALAQLKQSPFLETIPLLPTPAGPTPAGPHLQLDTRNGLVPGVEVSIAPDDTGRDSPTIGRLVVITPEEVVITPQKTGGGPGPSVGEVRIHFPRIGFAVRPVGQGKL